MTLQVGDLPGRRVVAGRERVDAVAHAPGRDREHAPELAAAQHADGGAGQDDAVHGSVSCAHLRGLLGAERAQPLAQLGARRGEDRHRQQAGVGRAGLADRQRADRHAAGHLHDRQQRVEALERGALHRHAEHRQHRVRRHHAGQVRRAAGAGDDHLDAARLGALRELRHPHRRAVGRDDCLLVGDAEPLEHRRPRGDIVSQSEVEPMMTATSGCIAMADNRKVYRDVSSALEPGSCNVPVNC